MLSQEGLIVLSRDKKPEGAWCLYLIECRSGALYAGITNNLEARYARHCAGKGARYTRANPPVRLAGSMFCASKSEALKAEIAIRKLPANRKLSYLSSPAEQNFD